MEGGPDCRETGYLSSKQEGSWTAEQRTGTDKGHEKQKAPNLSGRGFVRLRKLTMPPLPTDPSVP
jgi:hypothetical protein